MSDMFSTPPRVNPVSNEANEVRFYRRDQPFFCFTNFSEHQVVIGGRTWKTTEHFFQAQKFAITDPASVEAVWSAPTPKDAAAIGRDRNRPIRPDWEQIKDDVMRIAVFTKVLSHPQVREELLSTGHRVIIEDTAHDSYWGCGADGKGTNMLGKILMEARDALNSRTMEDLRSRTNRLIEATFKSDKS